MITYSQAYNGYFNRNCPKECLEAVKQDGHALQYVKEQTHEICLEAVKKNGHALYHVKEQTYELCLEAVKQNGFALRYVKEQTNEICLEAVKRDGYALQYVEEQTHEICLEAVKQWGNALQYVKLNKIGEKMKLTESVYIDKKGGLFLEYFGDNGFYNYIHINKKGKVKFINENKNTVRGTKCNYYLDYCSRKTLTAKYKIEELIVDNKILSRGNTDLKADDIPF